MSSPKHKCSAQPRQKNRCKSKKLEGRRLEVRRDQGTEKGENITSIFDLDVFE